MLVATKKLQPVLLSTLIVNVSTADNQTHTLQALLDTGAQVSFITKQSVDRLSLTRRHCSTQVNAFSGASINVVSGITSIVMSPVGKQEPLDVFIVLNITDSLPQTTFTFTEWPHLSQLELADPTFNIQGSIDILLGADIAPAILTGSRIAGHQSHPIAFGTVFGWVLMGPAAPLTNNTLTSMLVNTETALEQSLKNFWEIEESPHVQHLSPDEIQAEDIFTTSVKRLESGKFSVALPFKQPRPILGESKVTALKRLHYLEHRLSLDKGLSQQYTDFMRDYLTSEHMEVVSTNQRMTPYCFYIPHHCILRPESHTTKLRVVFDASATTTTGQSLNGNLYTGRKLQQDLPQILIRARIHKILFTADIKQMYRQIEIHSEDRDYLRILWRFEYDQLIEEYRLRTVTYGTSCAPHQALRTLQYLAKIEETTYSLAAQIIMQDTFVDDTLTGANTLEEALRRQNQVISLCARGHFKLHKWASNSSGILQAVSVTDRSTSTDVLFNDELEAGLKILGMRWDPKQDHFSYTFHCQSIKLSKRSILSAYLPSLPVTFLAKHLMQLLWTSGVGWDDPIPEQVLTMWQRYQQELQYLQHLKIPRRITMDGDVKYELHAFSDSSEKGYAAAVYIYAVSTETEFNAI